MFLSTINKLKKLNRQRGSILVFEVVAIFIFSLVLLALLGYASSQLRLVRSTANRDLAFHIAEAGINYYQWHLAHFPEDYANGTGQNCNPCGPYLVDYTDTDTGQVVGQYSLTITPPLVGSTIVTIESTGSTLVNPGVTRTITVRYGIPSLAQYGFLTHSFVRVGAASTFYGSFHSNSGIEFNGTGNAPVTSARQTYTCQGSDGCVGTHPGIWGTAAQATQNFWQFPVPNVDYSSITADLATIKTNAQDSGLYLPPVNPSGYSLVFLNDGTFRVYRVSSLRSHPTGTDVLGQSHSEDIDYNGRVELNTVCDPYPCQIPANGLVFVEDEVWVEGTVNGRVMVAAAILPYNPSTSPNIYIPGNITYAAQDGSSALGLIAQKGVVLTYYAPNNLDIHAALIAQNGSFQRYNFPNTLKNMLTVYGSISSFGQAGIFYGTSGYQIRNYTYDSSLLYGPPPSFPLSASGYEQISWTSN